MRSFTDFLVNTEQPQSKCLDLHNGQLLTWLKQTPVEVAKFFELVALLTFKADAEDDLDTLVSLQIDFLRFFDPASKSFLLILDEWQSHRFCML